MDYVKVSIYKSDRISIVAVIVSLCLALTAVFSPLSTMSVYAEGGSITADGMSIHVINLGNDFDRTDNPTDQSIGGDAVLVESGGEFILMDTGAPYHADTVKAALKKYGAKKLTIYISHVHTDHYGGLWDIAADPDFTITKLYLPDPSLYGSLGSRIIYYDQFAKLKIDTAFLKKGSSFQIGSADFSIIGPTNTRTYEAYLEELKSVGKYKPGLAFEKEYDAAIDFVNNQSLVCIVKAGNTKFFTAADMYPYEANSIVDAYPASELKCDIMKLNHHGTASANTEALLNSVAPTYSFACNTGYAGWTESASGKLIRKTYSTAVKAKKYGMPMFSASENKDLHYEALQGTIKIRRGSLTSEPLAGFFQVQVGTTSYDPTDYYYINRDTYTLQKGIIKANGSYRSFEGGGYMKRGTFAADGTYDPRVYYNTAKTSLRNIKSNGVIVTGYNQLYSKYYYFDKALTASYGLNLIGDSTYPVLNLSGVNRMLTPKGTVWTGGFVTVGASSKYANSKGVALIGFHKISGKLYNFDSSGLMVKGKAGYSIVSISGKKYLINSKGVIFTGGLKKMSDGTYYASSDGKLFGGWKTLKSGKYYFDKATHKAASKLEKIGGKYYTFDKSLHLVTSTGTKGKLLKKVKIQGKKYKISKKGVVKGLKIKKPGAVTNLACEYDPSVGLSLTFGKTAAANRYVIYISKGKNDYSKAYLTKVTKKYSGKGVAATTINFIPEEAGTYYVTIVPYNRVSDVDIAGKKAVIPYIHF